jgi:S-adenosylmethionine hydrolase
LDVPTAELTEDSVRGAILLVDRFGNLVTNIDRRTFDRFAARGPVRIGLAGTAVQRLVDTYADIGSGEVCALFGSTDRLEIAAHAASAAERLGVGVGARVEIKRG